MGEESQENPLLIRIEEKAGHGAGKPTEKIIAEYADVYAYMGWSLGVKLPSNSNKANCKM